MADIPSRADLVAGVIDIVVRMAQERGIEIHPEQLSEASNVRDFDLDSMDQVAILNEIEDAWRVTVDDDAARGGNNIGSLVDALAAALAAKP
jgi:acyl carrier protein